MAFERPNTNNGTVNGTVNNQHQMEYCENTLRHLIDHGELWREEQRCWRLFRQMLEGVDFIHSKGIIHRLNAEWRASTSSS